jgi:hypothetical protein
MIGSRFDSDCAGVGKASIKDCNCGKGACSIGVSSHRSSSVNISGSFS